MTKTTGIYKDKCRVHENNIYTAQKVVWEKANNVCDQLIHKTAHKDNVFSENFLDFIYGMFGEIKGVQTYEYKKCKALHHNTKKNVCVVIEQSKNRIRNLYIDCRLSNATVYSEIRAELTEMKKLCLRMNKKFRH